MTATIVTLHDLSIIPASLWKWYPAENLTSTGPTLVVTLALSSVRCNRDSPTRFGTGGIALSRSRCGKWSQHDGSTQTPQTIGRTWRTCQSWYVIQDRHSTNLRWFKGLRAQHWSRSCFHRIHDFPCVPASFDLDETERIIEQAREESPHLHHLLVSWSPAKRLDPELPVADDLFVEDFGSLDIMGGHVFTDGSRGAETKDPRLRRCGFGIAWIFSEGGLLSTLHGRNQSVAMG